MIQFAERGLVAKGRPNLGLFNQLYCHWVLFTVFGAIAIILLPVLKFAQGNFDVPLKDADKAFDTCIENILLKFTLSCVDF